MTSSIIDPTANARVRSLGYLRVDATDLDAWVRYRQTYSACRSPTAPTTSSSSEWTRKNTVSRSAKRTRTA